MICTRCKNEFDDTDPRAKEYNVCKSCWNEWIRYSIIVINDLRLDMSLKEHRALLRKYERVFFGLDKPEGIKDLQDESQRNPDQ